MAGRRGGGQRDPARHLRRALPPQGDAGRRGGGRRRRQHRLRPILMTSFAMIAGMVPMALGLGEGGEQTAPLGRAVIGGLLAATVTTLLVLPSIFAVVRAEPASFRVARSR